ncbi:protocadherin gamma-C5-like isoform X36 [Pyxicephalus adspersus]|uniref:protocadherin gamma-C5-like isoform X36 n=1 Tax=Pyxicephalus adspersus TaxID=30357 RepID=UPI003B5AE700
MDIQNSAETWKWQVKCFFFLCSWGWVSGQLRYSVVEESEPGTAVGNVAQDLGLKISDLSKRKLRMGSEGSRKYFAVNWENGALVVNEKIDRESLCGSSTSCVLPIEVVIENPLQLHRFMVEVLDINDNSPMFSNNERTIKITELIASPGARFTLESAHDLDVGTNGIKQYKLEPSPYFSLSVKNRKDGTVIPELVLEKVLDREEADRHHLILTAIDGGTPPRSGTTQINVIVMDLNDNPPTFEKGSYKVNLKENTAANTILIKLNATDLDEGANGEIEYSFDDHTPDSIKRLFALNPSTGVISVIGPVDHEESKSFELSIRAKDKGVPEMEGSCIIHVEVDDVNDNAPEILLTSLMTDVPEDTPIGTVVGLFRVNDKDMGPNGEQAQPNVDWRISQAQRPGPSGAQPTEEAGVWPNNQFETERLQAMILASANEAAEGTSGLGGSTGTMGLSARYGPQFTLQHVPDYRQNVYIPGSTLTPTNAAGKRDGKGGGNKKKSGKKDKK